MARIVISGRHLGVTEAMKEYATEKAGKLARVYERITKIEVTMDVTHHNAHEVEIVVDASHGARLVGKAESPDMYAAVDLAEDKLLRQLLKHKQKLSDHHRGEASMGGGASNAGEKPENPENPENPEETYDDAIKRLGEE